jgi:UDP-N-acetylmuramate: L-alanyl-gamma-D-glutamyl-meso-diaminopimelate ligase
VKSNPKKLHIIGICGVATSAIGLAFHKKGWSVTGSDKGFYPPVSTHLSEGGISFYAGWHPENLDTIKPEIVMIGGIGTSPNNPEVIWAKEHNVPIFTYAEIIRDYFIKKNSIVTAGTWGKTTTSSLLSFILIQSGLDPSYFTGGLSLSHATGALSESEWSVVEGDEYQTSISDKKPKFAYYSPTHLLLTSVSWDHADLYPTEKDYFDTFTKLVREIPQSGKVVACIDEPGVQTTLKESGRIESAVTYGASTDAQYRYHSIIHTTQGLTLTISHSGKDYTVSSPMLGRFNAENITACFAMAHTIGIPAEKIISAIQDFKGIKRRFEKRFEGTVTVLDCHAPTADKAASVLESIREVYTKKIIAVYEPNIGGRQKASAGAYDGAFKDVSVVIIPRLTKLKIAEGETVLPFEGDELTAAISKTQPNVEYIEDDAALISRITNNLEPGDVIVFLGSHGFRGMIEETMTKVK